MAFSCSEMDTIRAAKATRGSAKDTGADGYSMIIAMPRDTSRFPERVYMSEICSELNRHRSTIVTWDNKNWLPEGLEFQTDENGWRYWDRPQLEQAREWVNNPARYRAPKRHAS